MTLIERIERGLCDIEDAVLVQRLLAALAETLHIVPPALRGGEAITRAVATLAAALADRSGDSHRD